MYVRTYRNGQWDGTAPPKKTKAKKNGVEVTIDEPVKYKRYGCKQKEARNVTEKKCQPEKVKERLKAKEETGPSFSATAETVSAFLVLLEDATEEEIKGDLHVESVDFQIPSNVKKHTTERFKCTKRAEKPDLVLRRGLSFKICLGLDREYSKAHHDISFLFKTGEGMTRDTSIIVRMNEDKQDDDSKKGRNWHAQLVSMDGKSIMVEITIPPNVIIGHWQMSVQSFTLHKGEDTIALQYDSDQDVIFLFNPWCPEDTTYFPTSALLDEYVLNDKGAVYQGNYRQISAKPWRFGQFEEGILDICLMVLNKAFDWMISAEMADPVLISRAISSIVNNNDNYGILVGNWSGDYTGGKSPTSWTGSVKILKQYNENREPVKFGQCWVFSALVVTVCRALGLPCKSITNFASAHDSDASCTIDSVYEKDEKGELKPVEKHNTDSCWNFHVWNEVWMARKDLPPGYDGWQAIDATPQERSEGMFACGPAPIAAIKEGDCIIKYDTRFLFSEVNADRVYWEIVDGIWNKLRVARHSVGKKISTKNPNDLRSLERHDETACYKHSEGSKQERYAVMKATSSSTVKRDTAEIPQDIDFDITEIDDVLMGTDVAIKIKVKNIAESKETRTVNLEASVSAVKYNAPADPKNFIKREKFPGFSLAAGEEKVLKFVVTNKEYEHKLLEQGGMEVKAFGIVKETRKAVVEIEDFRVRRPDVAVKMGPEEAELNSKVTIKMSLKNPLSVPLTNCSYSIDSEALGDEETKTDDVPAKGEWNVTLEKTVWECPLFSFECIHVGFDCKELPNITGISNTIRIF
ncbi:annulin-like [Mizuhopecten yessoensis]|uniref:protein-glutamine gamma-glutamyltransferase n=1 Tax=Mizuhopecten yessoensis TaxID=6573 RepID=A0A210PLM6_MIZYE|nr:annulin-like [Mizuhopecten yessoensis]OWF37367.1 Protein-glutamine gamma-glutamyltransferase K [Mizuhopecten yessoensis]